MEREAIEYVLNYCEDQGCDAQITFEDENYSVIFRNKIHRNVCFDELNERGFPLSAGDIRYV